MNSKVDIQGDAGVVVKTNEGTINIQIVSGSSGKQQDAELLNAVKELKALSASYNLVEAIERVSYELFKTRNLLALKSFQLKRLHTIACEMGYAVNLALTHANAIGINEEIDERQFAETTGIHGTSAPERQAIRLLLKENVNTATIEIARRQKLLKFNNDHQLDVLVPKAWRTTGLGLAVVAMAIVLLPLLFFLYFLPQYHGYLPRSELLAFAIVQGLAGLIGGGMMMAANSLVKPYLAASKIEPHLQKVNLKLKNNS